MCGAVRFALTGQPFDAGWCHCRTCQLWSGAPAMAFASVKPSQHRWIEGEEHVRWLDTSSFGRRAFCGKCAGPLLFTVRHQPDTVDFPIAMLDEPDAIAPGFHIFWSSKVGWFNPGDSLPRHDQFRPNTRGLGGTAPPDNSSLTGGS